VSVFSEEIKSEIKKSGRTLLYLSGISGLSLDHISKMRLGKRLPQDERKIRRLIGALECTDGTERRLLSLYKAEKMGKSEWDCIEETKRLLEFQWNAKGKYSEPLELMGEKDICRLTVLNNRSEICAFLMRVMTSEWQYPKGSNHSVLYMKTGRLPEEIVCVLAACGERKEWFCEHLFMMLRNVDAEAACWNLQSVNRLLPFLGAKGRYVPVFEYVEYETELDINWIVGEKWALGMDKTMESGLVIWDEAQIEYLRNYVGKRIRCGRRLLEPWIGREEILCEAAESERKKYFLSEFPYPLLWKRRESCLHWYFSLEGLKKFLLGEGVEEKLAGTSRLLRERRRIVEEYLSRLEVGEETCRLTDRTQFTPAFGNCWFVTSVGAGRGFSVHISDISDDTGTGMSINEPGIAERIFCFMELMESGEFLLSRKESICEIRRLLIETKMEGEVEWK